MPKFYIIIARKIFSGIFFGGHVPSLPPVTYAYVFEHKSVQGVCPSFRPTNSIKAPQVLSNFCTKNKYSV